MTDSIIVTAFYDIGRGNNNIQNLNRSNKQYLEYFSFWARLKNKLIVYVSEEFKEDVYLIRKKFGLEDQTTIICIDDPFSLNPDIWEKMETIRNKGQWNKIRLYVDAMSNNPQYDYIMMMKYWFLKDAEQRTNGDNNIIWLDFGFNHGGKCYPNADEFNFYWNPQAEVGIHVFTLHDPNKVDSISQLLLQQDCIMGAPIIVTKGYAQKLWAYIVEAMHALLSLDCYDDDQQLLLMAYRWHSNDFILHKSYWFTGIKEFGGEHLSIRPEFIRKVSSRKTLRQKVKQVFRKIYYLLKNDHLQANSRDYGYRMKHYAREYIDGKKG